MIPKSALHFLKNLSNAFGPSGFEREVLRLVHDYVEPISDSVNQDKMGSLMFRRKGTSVGPTILMPGHVDEVGFIISGINEKGFLTFNPLGGWFDQVLLGQRVIVRTRKGDNEGVIAAKPPHVLLPEERNKLIDKSKMFIDIGCSSKKEAEELDVRIGDPVVPQSQFSTFKKTVFNDNAKEFMTLAMGKAFDDRVGAFMAAEVLRRLHETGAAHPNTLVGAATVQEEVGARGALTAGWVAEPDVVIALEVDISGDVPGIESHQAPAKMGFGPSLTTHDASMIPNQPLKELVIDTAKANGIPLQLSALPRGGTDAGQIHKLRAGCPGVVINVPTRHIHSHVGIMSLSDVEHSISLLVALVKLLDTKTVESFTAY